MVVFLTVSAEVGSIFFELSDFQNVKLYFVFITSNLLAMLVFLAIRLFFYTCGHSVKQNTSYVVPLFYFSPSNEQR